jgi:hypothetical protein
VKENTANEQKPAETMQTESAPPTEAAAFVLPWKRFACAILAGIPFFLTLPYTFHSWRISPMDRPNWIFHLAFLLLAACAVPAMKDSVKELKRFGACGGEVVALLFAFGFLCIYLGVTFVRQINMMRILAGMAFWWSCVWFFCGWRGAWAALPAFAALSLGCTSSTFLLCNHFLIQPQTALFLKIGAAVLCAVLCTVIMLSDYVMQYGTLLFLLSVALIVCCVLSLPNNIKPAPPFRPDFSVAPAGFTIAETPLTEDTIRFFEGAEVHQYAVSDGIFHCSFLEVKCGNDIHKIHPASHCLRSSGAVIQSESVVMHTMPDGQKISVTEIRSKIRGTPILTFVWYTGPEETLGSYFWFRSSWSASKQWYSYQAVTEIYDGNEEAARKFLLDLLSRLKRPYECPALERRR